MRCFLVMSLVVGLVAVTQAADIADSPRQGPRPVAPQFAGVGRRIPEFKVTDVAGKPVSLVAVAKDKKAVVIAFTSTSCPVSKKYLPTFAKLEQEYISKGVTFIYVNPLASDKATDIQSAIADQKLTGTYIHDAEGTLAKALGANTTGDVFLLDSKRTVVYRGAVDDRYGIGYALETAKVNYLSEALDATLADKEVKLPANDAPGCALDLASAKSPAMPAVTYHNRISRILQQNCQECHRTGGVGPFTLDSLEEVVAHKGMIKKVVDKGTMPPWFAVDGKDDHHKWANNKSLTADDKSDLLAWFDKGSPAGDVADAPKPRTYPADWVIGKPDLIVQIPTKIAIKADGVMDYQNVMADTNLSEDKWIQSFEVKPTNRAVVHHVLIFAVLGDFKKQRPEDRDGFFAAYVPGNDHQIYPEGFAKKLPKGSKLLFQIHYTPNGKATEDQLKIGMVYAKATPKYELKVAGLANNKILIPPGDGDYVNTATLRVPFEAVITGFMPHMHVRGSACKYEMTVDGKTTTLLDVPKYDFNWQLKYQLAEPITVPLGTPLKYTAHFDNSAKNPANPDPTKEVKWGKQTSDEMMLGYIEYYRPVAVK